MAISDAARRNHDELFPDRTSALKLVSLGGADPQVRVHVAGNFNVGNDRNRLQRVLTVLIPFIGYPRALNGLAAINEITRE